MMATQAGTEIRWICRMDLEQVVAIEAASHETPWTADDFTSVLRVKNNIGMVAEVTADGPDYGRIVGFMIYQLCGLSIELINIAVAPEYRRYGIGLQLMRRLRPALKGKRRRLNLVVSEKNTTAHLFFAACGMRAVGVERGPGGTAYCFSCGA